MIKLLMKAIMFLVSFTFPPMSPCSILHRSNIEIVPHGLFNPEFEPAAFQSNVQHFQLSYRASTKMFNCLYFRFICEMIPPSHGPTSYSSLPSSSVTTTVINDLASSGYHNDDRNAGDRETSRGSRGRNSSKGNKRNRRNRKGKRKRGRRNRKARAQDSRFLDINAFN